MPHQPKNLQEAYKYRIINSSENYFVYTDTTLLGSLQKRRGRCQRILIEIMEHQYQLETLGFINPVISVTNITTKELIGKIKILNFARLLPKVFFEFNDTRLRWVKKNIFSLHWQWKKGETTIIEAIENLKLENKKAL